MSGCVAWLTSVPFVGSSVCLAVIGNSLRFSLCVSLRDRLDCFRRSAFSEEFLSGAEGSKVLRGAASNFFFLSGRFWGFSAR